MASPGTSPKTAGNPVAVAKDKAAQISERKAKAEKERVERAWAKAVEKTVARERVDSKANVTIVAYGATRPSVAKIHRKGNQKEKAEIR